MSALVRSCVAALLLWAFVTSQVNWWLHAPNSEPSAVVEPPGRVVWEKKGKPSESHKSNSPRIEEPFIVEEDPTIRIALIRAIGNALPPRHDPAQTIGNLNFTLQHEARHPNVQRHWLLNHIADPDTLQDVISLLKSHNEAYTIEALNLTHYGRIRHVQKLVPGGADKFHHNKVSRKLKPSWGNPFKVIPDRRKRVYAINVNGARNTMIDIGINEMKGDWILPLDGNCFFPDYAMEDLVRSLQRLTNHVNVTASDKYVTIPMLRLPGGNDDIFTKNFTQEDANEEAQIAFHRDAKARYHPGLWYGKANKIDLLCRLNMLESGFRKWVPVQEMVEGGPVLEPVADLPDGVQVSAVSWVARLESGNQNGEVSIKNRGAVREKSIRKFLQGLDDRMLEEGFGFDRHKMLYYDETILNEERRLYEAGDTRLVRLIGNLTWHIEQIPSDYQVERECTKFRAALDDVTLLALGSFMHRNATLGKRAVDTIVYWFFATEAEHPAESWVGDDWSCIFHAMNGLPHFLDAVRLLRSEGYFDQTRLHRWMEKYVTFLESAKEKPRKAFASPARDGTLFDIQMVTVSSFLGDKGTVQWYQEHSTSRTQPQFTTNRALKYASQGERCENMKLLTLQAWATLSRMADKLGCLIWEEKFQDSATPILCEVQVTNNPLFLNRSPCKFNTLAVDGDRWWPQFHATRSHCKNLQHTPPDLTSNWLNVTTPGTLHVYDHVPVFDPGYDVAPFWNLGLVFPTPS